MTAPTAPELDVFKDIITFDEVEDQILANLQTWFPTYMAEICRQKGIDPTNVPAIRSWVTLQKFRHEPQNQTPAIVIVNAGNAGKATKDGSGVWRMPLLIGISAIISARDQDAATRTSKLYSAAVRAIMLQQRGGVSLMSDIAWNGETFDDIDVGSPDMLAAATATFEIVCDGLVKSSGAGPKVPSVSAPAPMPVVIEDPGRIIVEERE